LKGKLSLVGAPLSMDQRSNRFVYPKGLTGFVQINPNRGIKGSDLHHFDLYYLQNYSIWLDFDILAKTVIRQPNIFKAIENELDEMGNPIA
jgi:lipopolysaccharide/colanic/teichoic acid biosynthesis glycosyltransferase